MPKLSYLLIFGFFIVSCVSSTQKEQETQSSAENTSILIADTSKAVSASVTVDKENNAFKVTTQNKKSLRPVFDWPVWEARMTRGYLPRGTKKRKRPHRGIDLAAPRGSAVMSSHDGVVIYTGAGFKGYGKMIMIESQDPRDGGNWATLYGHLDKILVYEGKKVKQGEVVGALGNTGRSSGPHLHFEIRRLNGPLDPLPLLPAGEALTNDVDNGAIEE